MKLIATRPDGAELYYTRTEQRERPMGKPLEVEMGLIMIDGKKSPEKEIMNLVKFSTDWMFVNS